MELQDCLQRSTDKRIHFIGSTQQNLLLRASLVSDTLTLKPVYALFTPPNMKPVTSDYRVDLVDNTGHVVATHPLTTIEIHAKNSTSEDFKVIYQQPDVEGHGHFEAQILYGVVSALPVPIASVRVRRLDTIMAERTLQIQSKFANEQNVSATENGNHLVLKWSDSNTPITIRYRADDGITWVTLAVDLDGGSLTLDPILLPNNGHGQFEIIPADSVVPTVLKMIR